MTAVHRCPDCRCADDAIPQPVSSAWARRQALEAAAAAVTAAREKRKKPKGAEE